MCEDFVKLGSCFIVVCYKWLVVYILFVKVNLFKGIRIKYRIEEFENSFDFICELIYYYVIEKKLLILNILVVIIYVVSCDVIFLLLDDLKSMNFNYFNRYVINIVFVNVCLFNFFGIGFLC